MKYFFDTLYLVYFSPVEFPYFWGEYHSKLCEFLVVLFSAFSIALGFSISSIDFSELGIFLFFFLLNVGFLFIYSKFFSWLVNQRAREYGVEFNQKIFISYLNYSLVIFWFMPSIVSTTSYFEANNGASLTLIILALSLIYILHIVRGVTTFYRLEQEIAFKIIFGSVYWLVLIPIFLAIYYLITIFFLLINL